MAPLDFAELATAAESAAAHRITKLPIVVLNVHSSCNCRCVMCDIWKISERRAVQPSDLQPHLSSFRRLGVEWVVFSGGEPLLNPAFPQLCEILKREHIRVTLLTTGLLLAKSAERVAESFDDIIISLDGPQQIHDSIRRVPGGFRVIEAGIRAVRNIRVDLRMTARTTVQKANFRHLRDTVAVAKRLGLQGISFLAADLTSQAFNRSSPWPVERQNEIGLSLSEIRDLEIEVGALIRDHGQDLHTGFIAESPAKLWRIVQHFRAQLGLGESEAPVCNAPWASAVVETDGSVRPCFFHAPIGNIRDESLEQVINSDKALQFRSKLDIRHDATCKRCVCSLNYRGSSRPSDRL